MLNDDLKERYLKDGYVVVRGVVKQAELNSVRTEILSVFNARRRNSNDVGGSEEQPTEQLRPAELLEHLPQVVSMQFVPAVTDAVRQIFGDDFHYVNDIHIQRNQKLIGGHAGWHIDASSNFGLRYLNNALDINSYRFAKIGVYLQSDDCPTGGSVDIVPKSHRIGRVARGIVLRLLESKLNRMSAKLNRVLGMAKLFGAVSMDLHLQPGDCIVFDCRLIHRSSPVKIFGESKPAAALSLDKLTVYWEVGDKSSATKFLKNDLVRALAHENVPLASVSVKPFSHYLRLKYPDDYPQWYVEQAREMRVKIAQFENDRDLEIARQIYL